MIDDTRGVRYDTVQNENFASLEIGTRFRSLNRKLSLDANVYYTQWTDRTRRAYIRNFDGDPDLDGVATIRGIGTRHMGLEIEAAYQLHDFVRFDGAMSWGDWKHTNNPAGNIRPDEDRDAIVDYTFYLEGLYVGDAPQMQLAYALSAFPAGGLYAQLVGRSYGKHYANYGPYDRTGENTGEILQSWRAPGYTVFDFHASYKLSDEMAAPFGGKVKLFMHGFNILNSIYIQDAIDNSPFNGYWDEAEAQARRLSHQADDAEVFLGYPRSFNFGFQIYH